MVADIKKKQIEKWIEEGEKTAKEIGEELKIWTRMQVSPADQNNLFDLFQLDARLHALILYLVDKEVVVDEEFVNMWLKPQILKNLRQFRETIIEPAVEQIKQQKLVASPMEVPQLLGPDGKPVKFH